MPRARLGVALLVPEPVATEIDGMRRALGDGALGRIPAHLTLVPPVNVALDRLGQAAEVVRNAAAASPGGPIDLTLGPPATFWPVTPVVYLTVGGDTDALLGLRDRVFRPPLERPLTYDFVPHVTLADEVEAPGRIEAAVAALAGYTRRVRFERIQLLQEGAGRVWAPIAEADLGPAAVVGRGGLPLELITSTVPDAVTGARLGLPAPVTVTARRDGEAIGVAEARLSVSEPGAAWLVGLDVAPHARRAGAGAQLLAALVSALAERDVTVLRAPAPPAGQSAGFLDWLGFIRAGAGGPLERRL